MLHVYEILGLVATALHVLGGVSALHAVLHARSPQGSVAWALSLVFLPYVTLPLYWSFGRRRFEGYVSSRRAGDTEVNYVARTLQMNAPALRAELEDERGGLRVIEQLAHMPFTRGNAARLLVDGQAAFAAIFAGIEAARDYVLVQFFIVHDDELGRELKQRLVRKAAGGVRVYFLYDEIGSHRLPRSYVRELRAAGIQARAFHSRRGRKNRFQINFRNHRKLVVADGRRAWLGGLNVGDEYLGRDPHFGHWRDTLVELEGPAVQSVQIAFLEDWYWAAREVPTLEWEPRLVAGEGQNVLVLPSGPNDEFEACGLFFAHAISSARRRLWISSPYFVPDSQVVSALQLAGLRGVDVRILLPGRPDHLIAYLAAFTYLGDCARAGVRFFRYRKGFLHQKAMLVDDVAGVVGTANLDNRSFKLNFEITSVVLDRAFAAEVERMLETDLADSIEVGGEDFERRPLWFRVCARTARLFAPLL